MNPLLHDRIIGQLVSRGAAVTVHQEIASLDRMLPLVLAGSALGITVPSAAAANPFAWVVYRHFIDPARTSTAGSSEWCANSVTRACSCLTTWMADAAGAGRRVAG